LRGSAKEQDSGKQQCSSAATSDIIIIVNITGKRGELGVGSFVRPGTDTETGREYVMQTCILFF
jgi:hypothetical protein